MSNIVFYFSGTGNCLKAAKDISKELTDCEIVSMGKSFDISRQYERIGFIYPTYFWGLPRRVIEFIKNINFDNNKNAYFFGIATYGGEAGNAIYQLYELLKKEHGIKLSYGQKLKMFSNYVVMYDMSTKVNEIIQKANKAFIPIVNAIKNKTNKRIIGITKIFEFVNRDFIKNVSEMDKNFNINNYCSGCAICENICPVKNIEINNNKPQYKHHCENCIACLQYCPNKAINYKNATQQKRRYTNPEINYLELAKYNGYNNESTNN